MQRAQRSKRLRRPAKQPSCTSSHCAHDQIAIIAVHQEYESNGRVVRVQCTQRFYDLIVVCPTEADEQYIGGIRPQNLQTVSRLRVTNRDPHTRGSTDSTTQKLRLRLIGVGEENSDGIPARTGRNTHTSYPPGKARGKGAQLL